jgi:hypothetical protein
MAHLITSDDDYRDLTYDDAYRSYLITRTDPPYDYRFGRTKGKRVRVHARTAWGRVNGFLKNMIASIVDSKLRRMACPGRGAASFTLLRRAGTQNARKNMGPSSAAHR